MQHFKHFGCSSFFIGTTLTNDVGYTKLKVFLQYITFLRETKLTDLVCAYIKCVKHGDISTFCMDIVNIFDAWLCLHIRSNFRKQCMINVCKALCLAEGYIVIFLCVAGVRFPLFALMRCGIF